MKGTTIGPERRSLAYLLSYVIR